jgi:membrane-associated protease RseP (regulator of RpoE activity)
MEHSRLDWKARLLPLVALLIAGSPALAHGPSAGDGDPDDDKRIVFGNMIRLKDCPEVKVLGTGGARVLSLSPRTFLGVETSSLTPELREHFGVPADAGVMLSKIVADSAAEAAGLAVGDIVTRVDGEAISSAGSLGRAVRGKDGGDTVEIEYWRDGQKRHTTATLTEHERCSIDIGDPLRAIPLESLSGLGELGIEIGDEALESTLETLRQTFDGYNWDFKFEGLSDSEMERIEERMERVQERLDRLEDRLEEKFGRDVERTERKLERDREKTERDRERTERDQERTERDRDGGEDDPI